MFPLERGKLPPITWYDLVGNATECPFTHICMCVYVCVCACVCVCVCVHVPACMYPCSLQVAVLVGTSLNYTPGYITFVTSTVSQFSVTAVAGGMAGGGVSLILLLVLVMAIILVVHRRDSLKKSRLLDALMMQMKTITEEHKRSNVNCMLRVCGGVCV